MITLKIFEEIDEVFSRIDFYWIEIFYLVSFTKNCAKSFLHIKKFCVIVLKDFFWGFLRGLVLFFLKNNFSEIFIFALHLLCTLLDWVWYTIWLGPVHFSTGVRYTIQLESGTQTG